MIKPTDGGYILASLSLLLLAMGLLAALTFNQWHSQVGHQHHSLRLLAHAKQLRALTQQHLLSANSICTDASCYDADCQRGCLVGISSADYCYNRPSSSLNMDAGWQSMSLPALADDDTLAGYSADSVQMRLDWFCPTPQHMRVRVLFVVAQSGVWASYWVG